jgi:hypothetical protein
MPSNFTVSTINARISRSIASRAFALAGALGGMLVGPLVFTQVGCQTVPTGAGVYLVTIVDAKSGKPVEGVELQASGAGIRARGGKPAQGTTDEDGEATLAFGNWGAVDLMLNASGSEERWLVTQDRVSVNGGKSSKSPLRMIVGSGTDGGVSRYAVSITRVERGPKLDN